MAHPIKEFLEISINEVMKKYGTTCHSCKNYIDYDTNDLYTVNKKAVCVDCYFDSWSNEVEQYKIS